jgi:hypothetical protein
MIPRIAEPFLRHAVDYRLKDPHVRIPNESAPYFEACSPHAVVEALVHRAHGLLQA